MVQSSKSFIEMVTPILGMNVVEHIRKLTIIAEINGAVRCEIETFPHIDLDLAAAVDVTTARDKCRRFIVEVYEVAD